MPAPGKPVALLPLEDAAVSTSGDYERYFDEGGERYHHWFDGDGMVQQFSITDGAAGTRIAHRGRLVRRTAAVAPANSVPASAPAPGTSPPPPAQTPAP